MRRRKRGKKKHPAAVVVGLILLLAIVVAAAYGLITKGGVGSGRPSVTENAHETSADADAHQSEEITAETGAAQEQTEMQTSEVQMSEVQTPEVQMSEMQTPELQAAETQTSELQATELQATELQASEPQAAEVREVLDQMTVEEKVAQMFFVLPDALSGVSPTTVAGDITKQGFRNYPVGGIILMENNIVSAEQVTGMVDTLQNLSQEILGVPLFVGVDEEGGIVTRVAGRGIVDAPIYDSMLSIGGTGNAQSAYAVGASIGDYLDALHVNTDFAPVADVLTNADNQVIGNRSFGSDPEIVSEMVAQEVKGLQENRVFATLKHFPGHGNTAQDSHSGLAYTYKTLEELERCELLPFAAGIEAGATFVMVGHISCPNILGSDVPSTLSHTMCTEILRERLGFDGIIITDAMNMGAICNLYDSDYAAVQAIKAGVDIVLMPYDFETAYHGVLDAVRRGEITQERIDESVARILAVKQGM